MWFGLDDWSDLVGLGRFQFGGANSRQRKSLGVCCGKFPVFTSHSDKVFFSACLIFKTDFSKWWRHNRGRPTVTTSYVGSIVCVVHTSPSRISPDISICLSFFPSAVYEKYKLLVGVHVCFNTKRCEFLLLWDVWYCLTSELPVVTNQSLSVLPTHLLSRQVCATSRL